MVRGAKRGRGAALMEVMLSMAVLGAALCALVTAMSVALNAQARIEERAVVDGLSESKLLELRTQPSSATPGEAQGRFPEPYDAYTWLRRIEAPQANTGFARATVEIRKGDQSGVYRFQTLLVATSR